MEVGKDRGDQAAIMFGVARRDRRAIEQQLARCRPVEAGQDFHEGRFARAVAAGQDDKVAGVQREIERADLEHRVGGLAGIVEFDVAHLDLAELLRRLRRRRPAAWRSARACSPVREPVGRRVRGGDDRDRLHQAGAGADDEHQRGHGLGNGAGASCAEHRHHERDRAKQRVQRASATAPCGDRFRSACGS